MARQVPLFRALLGAEGSGCRGGADHVVDGGQASGASECRDDCATASGDADLEDAAVGTGIA